MSRNNNGGFDDEFDWEEYDKITSRQQPQGEPLSRRNRASANGGRSSRGNSSRPSGGTRQTRNTAAEQQMRLSAPKRRKKKKKKLTNEQIKFRKRLRNAVIVTAVVAFVVISSVFVGMYAAVSREIKDMNIKNLALNSTSFIYYNDAYGTPQELEQIQTASNRIWIDSDKIPQIMKDAMVSIEDERFYKHHGVDIKRTLGATMHFALAKIGIGSASYGGSTITQQVIKNITSEKEVTATRKIKEMMRAIALENQLSKDEILTLYLNIVYFANNCNGVEAASNAYFAKEASELTLAEAASIAGITQYPSEYDPYVHPDKNIEKRNTVLKKMNELGYITETEYNEAASSDLVVNNAYKENGMRISSYFVDQVITDVIADLQTKKGYSLDFATQQVYNGGLKIYSTVDVNVQRILEDVYYNTTGFPRTGKGAQSAMVIIDPYTGQIKGLMGGLGEKTDVRGFNRASQAMRQPGSSIKPLSVYGPAVDLGKITEATIVVDEEITIGSDKWKPKNSYNEFYGPMTVREALARSSNIPAVKVLDMVGISTSYGYLQNKFHLGYLNEDDKNFSSLALGGLTKGVSPQELAAAYSVFVNSGKYIEPYTYFRVEDSTGQIILDNTTEASQAISAAAAYITSDMLRSVLTSAEGTAYGAALSSGMPSFGKTGTTDDNFDKWFVGFTPYYVGAVWYGFDNPSSIAAAGVSGNPCVNVWNIVMERVHEGLSVKELERPTNVVEATVCMASGMLASSTCNAAMMYFVDGTQPKAICNSAHSSGDAYGTTATPAPTTAAEPTTAPSITDSTGTGSDTTLGGGDYTTGGGTSSGGDYGTGGDYYGGDYTTGGDTMGGDYSGDYTTGGDAYGEEPSAE